MLGLKEERKLSFNHWRYCLLHWTFNVKNPDPKNPEKNGLPMYFYRHYCPLFHFLGCGFDVVEAGIKKISGFFKQVMDVKLPMSTTTKDEGIAIFIKYIARWHGGESFGDFYYCIDKRAWVFAILSDAEMEDIWNEVRPKIVAEQKQRKLRKEATLRFFLNLIKFSQAFFKALLNVAYVCFAGLVAYVFYLIIPPICNFVGNFIAALVDHVGNIDILAMLDFVVLAGAWLLEGGAVLLAGGTAITFAAKMFTKFAVGHKLAIGKLLVKPIILAWHYGVMPIVGVRSLVEFIYDFVSMFYEENCPPITIVTDEEKGASV